MKKITSLDYDSNIISQGLQFQIDTYYEPKEISEKRRAKIIMEAGSPKSGEKILDIGCGVGTFAYHMAKAGAITFGIDYSKESIKIAQLLVKKFGVADKTKFIVSNATKLPFKDGYFDKVIATDFIEHINFEEKKDFLKELYRILKAEGIAIIFTPNGIREKIGGIYWRLCKDKIPDNSLHLGLINRFQFEPLLKKYKFNFKFQYKDITRPYLTKLPIIRHFLSLNLLWILKKT